MRFKLFLVLVWVPGLLKAQFAVFTTDTMFHSEQDQMNSEWVIAGQHLTYGSPPIKVKTDDLLDTMYFRTDAKRNWDTIICQISQAQTYKFVYNDCCGGFYIADSNGHFIQARTIFKTSASKQWQIGKLGDDGILLAPGEKVSDTLNITCHSALMPNIFNVSFSEIKTQTDTTNFIDNTCIKMGNDYNYNYTYTSTKTYCNFLYMPLSNAPASIVIDRKKGIVMIVNGNE
jgi:hypothetical protein